MKITLSGTSARLFLLITISILSQNIISPQDLVETYSKYLPGKYIQLEYQHEQLTKLLKAKSSIHPDLIYYYLTYYNKLSESKNSLQENEINAFKGYIYSIENSLLQKRNAWTDRQIAQIDTMNVDPELKNRAESMFRELKNDLMDTSLYPPPIDKSINENLLNYFSAFFYNPKSYPAFLSDLRYSGYKKKEEDQLRDKILTLYRASERKDINSNSELVSLILDKWYLFDFSSEVQSNDPKPGEMVLNLLKQNNTRKRQPDFSFGVTFSPLNFACDLKESIFIKGLGRNEDFEIKNTIPQIGLSLGYKYYLKDVTGPFSFINFQFLYFTSISTKEYSSKIGFSQDYSVNIYYYHEELNFKNSIVTPKSAQSYYLKITTPVLFLFNTIGVECGVIAGMNNMKYKYQYEYSYSKTERYLAGSLYDPTWYTHYVAGGYDKKEYESTESDFIFSPEIELSVNSLQMASMGVTVNLQYSSFFFRYEL